ncbi:MAG TPA: Crp/Fnr family transcriptional regulator [Xanthobacteraceae bacterium]|nr:Crp/Fnr family transcriptional regulator [Xanthobacteraceae bacterium]
MTAGASRESRDATRRVLRECKLFGALSEAARDALAARARVRDFARGQTIFVMGEPGDSVHAVLEGEVRLSVASPAGRDVLLAIMRPGDIFGEIAVLDGQPRTADATALAPCSLAIIERREFIAALNREPQAWQAIVEILCARIRSADQQLAEIALLNVPVRLANVLLRHAEGDAGHRRAALSQRKLGELVGASRESVNKCLAQWRRAGILRVGNGAISITNPAALREIAAEET